MWSALHNTLPSLPHLSKEEFPMKIKVKIQGKARRLGRSAFLAWLALAILVSFTVGVAVAAGRP